jgi:hypothetical protein
MRRLMRRANRFAGCVGRASAGPRSRFGVRADLLPALRALLGVENSLAHADGFRRDFDELVVGDELDGLFEAQLAVRDQADGLVSA